MKYCAQRGARWWWWSCHSCCSACAITPPRGRRGTSPQFFKSAAQPRIHGCGACLHERQKTLTSFYKRVPHSHSSVCPFAHVISWTPPAQRNRPSNQRPMALQQGLRYCSPSVTLAALPPCRGGVASRHFATRLQQKVQWGSFYICPHDRPNDMNEQSRRQWEISLHDSLETQKYCIFSLNLFRIGRVGMHFLARVISCWLPKHCPTRPATRPGRDRGGDCVIPRFVGIIPVMGSYLFLPACNS